MKPPTMKELSAQCARWNAANPIGTHVDVQMDSGELRRTVTKTSAQILAGHTAVIWLEGIGCYLLSRVRSAPRPKSPEAA
jgi:hypothetical protein